MARAISVLITGSAAPLRRAIAEANKALSNMGTGANLAFGALASSTTLFAKQAVSAAAEDQRAQALLARQLQVSAGASREQIAAMESYIDATQRSVAVSDNALRPALAGLATATKDLNLAQDLLNLSIDVSAATGRDLETVSTALGRAYAGNMRGLQQLSPELKKAVKDGASFADVVGILRDNFAGAGAAASQTMAGQLAILSNTVSEAKEAIGAALLPVLQSLLPQLVNLANFAGRNAAILGTLGLVVGGFATSIVAARVALYAWQAVGKVTTVVNAALATSFSAVQVATGIGLVTALAAIPAYLKLKDTFADLKTGAYGYAGALGAVVMTQEQLNNYMGPVPSRNLAEFQKHYADWRMSLLGVDTALGKVDTRMQTFQSRLSSAVSQLRSYVNSIRDTITGTVSLSSAFAEAAASQADAEQGVKSALAERKQAYEELDQARITNDVEGYNAALQKVATAEKAVNEAQAVKPKSYLEVFRDQITAAKEFAGNLKKLIAAGLGKAGLQQILDLGPVAGNAVAKDLLAGTGGYTVGSLNADLASIAREATSVGMSIPGVSAALGATAAKTGNTYYIEVKAGVGDKVEIGKQVVEVLQAYEKRLGGVPIKVK